MSNSCLIVTTKKDIELHYIIEHMPLKEYSNILPQPSLYPPHIYIYRYILQTTKLLLLILYII